MSSTNHRASASPPSRLQSKEDEGDNESIGMSPSLARSSRRASISMPTGLDLLVKLAEYSWQNAPQLNSSFDDLVEAGGMADASPKVSRSNIDGNVAVVPARRRVGYQNNIPGRNPGPSGSTKTGFSEEEDEESQDDPGSELSEPEFSPGKGVSLNPSPTKNRSSGKRVGVRVPSKANSQTDEDEDDDFAAQLKPLSARRKGSIAPIRIHNSNYNNNINGLNADEEKGQVASPTPSAASISSLLREKLGQVPIPGMFRNKKPKEYKLQVFVAILFLTIILLVGSIYIIHKEKELQKSYFDRIRFSSKDRRIRVTNVQDRKVLSGILGVNLNARDKPWPCLMEQQRENETCLEWMGKGRLYLKTKAPPPKGLVPGIGGSMGFARGDGGGSGGNILCYGIYWEGLSRDFSLKDCYDMGPGYGQGGFFYGGGEMEKDPWPLNKTTVPYGPFLTGNKIDGREKGDGFQWGRSLRRYFVNSEGAALQITDESPLHVSINHPEQGQICFGAAHDGFGFPADGKLPFLNYTICTAENVLEISKRLADKDIWERLRHEDMQLSYFMASKPIWRLRPEILDMGNQSDVALLNHTNKIAAILPSEGFILLDETWQRKIGDLEGDPTRFSNLAETFNITKRRGFKLALTVQPFFSTQSENYVEGLEKDLWLVERARGIGKRNGVPSKGVPALTEYKQWNSVAVLDVTQEVARQWLHDKVKDMATKYGIEAVYADMGTCFDLPQYYEFSKPLPSADHAKDLFLQTLRSVPQLSTIGVSTAVKLPKPPTFVALSPIESSWEGLQTVIPNILSLGLAGFPFLIPGSIGGDYFTNDKVYTKTSSNENMVISHAITAASLISTMDNETVSLNVTLDEDVSNISTTLLSPPSSQSKATSSASLQLPSRELYIRWLQLAHFLPVVQYSFLPNDYDEEVVQIAQNLEQDRKQKISSYIKKAMDEALTTGMPIIRPLWTIDPLDPNCLRVSDEFAIGDDIIVAPILRPNSTERDIYLPRGIWKDELERSSTKGERWLHNYRAKLNQIPVFIKLPDTGQILSS